MFSKETVWNDFWRHVGHEMTIVCMYSVCSQSQTHVLGDLKVQHLLSFYPGLASSNSSQIIYGFVRAFMWFFQPDVTRISSEIDLTIRVRYSGCMPLCVSWNHIGWHRKGVACESGDNAKRVRPNNSLWPALMRSKLGQDPPLLKLSSIIVWVKFLTNSQVKLTSCR